MFGIIIKVGLHVDLSGPGILLEVRLYLDHNGTRAVLLETMKTLKMKPREMAIQLGTAL